MESLNIKGKLYAILLDFLKQETCKLQLNINLENISNKRVMFGSLRRKSKPILEPKMRQPCNGRYFPYSLLPRLKNKEKNTIKNRRNATTKPSHEIYF